jgi:hypothetical protein
MVRRAVKRALPLLVAALLVAQLVRCERTNPPVTAAVEAPAEVAAVLRRACYDCHSHETVWPWYSRVAPVSWLVAHDVAEGRDELNFSAWGAYDRRRKLKLLRETAEQVADGEMPPWYYTLMHAEARLGAPDRELLAAWTAEETARVRPAGRP